MRDDFEEHRARGAQHISEDAGQLLVLVAASVWEVVRGGEPLEIGQCGAGRSIGTRPVPREERVLRRPDRGVAVVVYDDELDVHLVERKDAELVDVGLQRPVAGEADDGPGRVGRGGTDACRERVAHGPERAGDDHPLVVLDAKRLAHGVIAAAGIGHQRLAPAHRVAERVDQVVQVDRP